jgi:hypothetical protein
MSLNEVRKKQGEKLIAIKTITNSAFSSSFDAEVFSLTESIRSKKPVWTPIKLYRDGIRHLSIKEVRSSYRFH